MFRVGPVTQAVPKSAPVLLRRTVLLIFQCTFRYFLNWIKVFFSLNDRFQWLKLVLSDDIGKLLLR